MLKKIIKYLIFIFFLVIPFNYEFKFVGAWVTVSDLIGATCLALWFYLVASGKNSFQNLPLIVPITAILAMFVISTAFSISVSISIKETLKYIFIFLLFYMLVNNIDGKFIRLIYYVATLCAVIVSVWFLYDYATGKVEFTGVRTWHRILPTYTQLNALGSYLATMLPVSLLPIFEGGVKNPRKTVAAALSAVLILIALVLTYSRASWFAAAAVLTLLGALRYRLKGVITIVGCLIGVLILIFALTGAQHLRQRFLSTFDMSEGSIMHRREYARAANQLIKKRPLTGVGPGNFALATEKFGERQLPIYYDDIPHNIFLQFACETGIISAVLLFLVIVFYFRDAYRIYFSPRTDISLKFLVLCTALGLLALMITGLFGDPFVRNTKEFFALLLALPYLIKSSSERLHLEKNCHKNF